MVSKRAFGLLINPDKAKGEPKKILWEYKLLNCRQRVQLILNYGLFLQGMVLINTYDYFLYYFKWISHETVG